MQFFRTIKNCCVCFGKLHMLLLLGAVALHPSFPLPPKMVLRFQSSLFCLLLVRQMEKEEDTRPTTLESQYHRLSCVICMFILLLQVKIWCLVSGSVIKCSQNLFLVVCKAILTRKAFSWTSTEFFLNKSLLSFISACNVYKKSHPGTDMML